MMFYFSIEIDFKLKNILGFLRREDPKNFVILIAWLGQFLN